MNHSFDLKCTVCESTYLIKHQIGYRSTEFFFECPVCGIMLSGEVEAEIDSEEVRIKSNFKNLENYEKDNSVDYFIQLSGEFYDYKLTAADDSHRFMPGSFMLTSKIGFEKIEKMAGLSKYVIDVIPEVYNNCSRVIELIVSNKENKKYVYSELRKIGKL